MPYTPAFHNILFRMIALYIIIIFDDWRDNLLKFDKDNHSNFKQKKTRVT